MGDRKRKLDVFTSDGPASNGAAATVNPFTGRAYSQKYYDILGKRKGAANTGSHLRRLLQYVKPFHRARALHTSIDHDRRIILLAGYCATGLLLSLHCCGRAAGVAGAQRFRGHDPQAPDDHPGGRDRVRQDDADRAVHLRGRLHPDRQDGCLHAAPQVRRTLPSAAVLRGALPIGHAPPWLPKAVVV